MLHCAAVIAAASVAAKRNTASVPCDVLIILGSRVDGDTPRADLRARIDAAAEYLKKYPSCIAIGTGGNFRAEQTVSEAQAIKNGLVADGIEPSRVLLEDKARTTYENFLNCKKIIEENAPENASVGILSNTYHLFRAGLIARDSGLEKFSLIPAPSPTPVRGYLRAGRTENADAKGYPESIVSPDIHRYPVWERDSRRYIIRHRVSQS